MPAGIQLLLKVLLAGGLLVFLGSKMDADQLWSVVTSARWSLVLAAIGIHCVTVTLSLLRWSIVVESFGMGSDRRQLLRFLLIGYYFNLFLPTSIGGDVVRSYYLARQQSAWFPTALTTTLLDRFIGLFGLLLVGTAGVAIHPISVQGQPLLPLFLAATAAFVAGAALLFTELPQRLTVGLLQRIGARGIGERVEMLAQALRQLGSRPSAILSTVTLSVVIQLVVVGMTWVAALALDLNAPFLSFVIFVPVINLTTMLAPVTINGIGLRETVYYLLFSEIGVPVEESVVLSLLGFAVMNVPSLVGGVVYLVSDLPSRQVVAEQLESAGDPGQA